MFGKYFFPLLFGVISINIHVIAKPTDSDINKITLDIPMEILNSTRIRVPTRWEKGVELLGQVMDAIRFGTGRIVNFGMMARNEIANRAEEFTSEAANAILSLIAARDARQYIKKSTKDTVKQQQQQKRSTSEITTASPSNEITSFDNFISPVNRETAQLENENKQSILEVPKTNLLGNSLKNFATFTPVVDRTKEEDKYGNEGGGKIGEAIVDGTSRISRFINTLLDFPGKSIKIASININKVLNNIGARIIGLA